MHWVYPDSGCILQIPDPLKTMQDKSPVKVGSVRTFTLRHAHATLPVLIMHELSVHPSGRDCRLRVPMQHVLGQLQQMCPLASADASTVSGRCCCQIPSADV